MKVEDIAEKIQKIVPLELAQDWDNVGLLVGDPRQNVNNILLTIDITSEVVVFITPRIITEAVLSEIEVRQLESTRFAGPPVSKVHTQGDFTP